MTGKMGENHRETDSPADEIHHNNVPKFDRVSCDTKKSTSQDTLFLLPVFQSREFLHWLEFLPRDPYAPIRCKT